MLRCIAERFRGGKFVKRKFLMQRWLVVSFLVMTTAFLQAQGRRGAGPAGGASTVEHVVVHGKALEGNLEGDSADRNVTVYLPPSYRTEPNRRYPVVYLLHGFGAHDDMFVGRLGNLTESADRLASAAGNSSPIIVMPDAFTLHRGSMYSSSVTTGDWETFIAQDLVAYVDSHYRTINARISRGLAGHGMGGYGALRIGMKRPDVFSSLYVMSAAFLEATDIARPEAAAPAEAIKTRAQAEEAARREEGQPAGSGPSLALAIAAAWSPNASNAPLFLDLPVKDGKVRPDIAAKWTANTGLAMVENQVSNLNKLYAVAIDIGARDRALASNRRLHEAMMRLKIAHSYEEYDGDATSRLGERIERNFLPFFSKNLAAPANPTSPAVQD
jgi:enterochelin esterase-like enzyme